MINRTQADVMKNWPKVWNAPMVSVRCLAYNQESYVRKTLDGFMMQETNFPFEVVVHDDASTDGTADIIREYEKKYPQIIKPIYELENQYSKRDGSIARIMLPYLKGKYVAFCEGDDYWCDANKLQSQFEALEKNPECSICLHNVQIIHENGLKINNSVIPGNKFKEGIITQDKYAYWLLSKAQCTFQLSSYFTRTDYLFQIRQNKPEYYKYAHVGDEKLQRYCLNKGNAFFIEKVMSCYRTQSKGSWNSREFSTNEQKKKHMEEMIKLDESFDVYSNYHFHSFIENGKKVRFFNYLAQTGQYKELSKKENRGKLPPIPVARKLRYKLYSLFPWLHNVVAFFCFILRKIRT